MVFGNYAKYYNLLYKDKDYNMEINYIDKLIKEFSKIQCGDLLDLGCGTGIHANLLCEKGYSIVGIDLSKDMINEAEKVKHPNASYHVGNASKFDLNKQFDVVTSLFHVVSYQTANSDIDNMFACVSKHLNQNGLFIFDFWYGPAVLTEKPTIRIKRLEDTSIKVFRIAEPEIHFSENIVDVNYELLIVDKDTTKVEIVKETHHMRYYFEQELNVF